MVLYLAPLLGSLHSFYSRYCFLTFVQDLTKLQLSMQGSILVSAIFSRLNHEMSWLRGRCHSFLAKYSYQICWPEITQGNSIVSSSNMLQCQIPSLLTQVLFWLETYQRHPCVGNVLIRSRYDS